jgi:hypothetical protein
MLARRGTGDITGTDMISSIQTRMSMEARRSHGGGSGNRPADREGLIRAYDEEEAAGGGGFGLTDLAEDTDEEDDPRSPMIPSFQPGRSNGHPPNGAVGGATRLGVKGDAVELQNRKSGER